MSTNLEIESKSMLSKSDYEKLIALFNNAKIYEQINYYIDSDSRILVSKNCGLRIRTKDGEIELTLKVPNGEGKLEINQQISDKQLKSILVSNLFPEGEVKQYIESNLNIKTSELHLLGQLVTERLDINYKTSLLSIDKSFYNSIVDYEIEAEDLSIKQAESNLKEFLKENKIEFKQSQDNKINRFLKSL